MSRLLLQKIGATTFLIFLLLSLFGFWALKLEVAKAQTTTFGYDTVGANTDVAPAGSVFGSRFTAPITGNTTQVNAYCSVGTIGATSGVATAAIYSDISGTPETLLGQSNAVTVGSTP